MDLLGLGYSGGQADPSWLRPRQSSHVYPKYTYPASIVVRPLAVLRPWTTPRPGTYGRTPPFSRIEEVVAKAAREGSHILVIAPDWPGPQYPWLASLCALCPKRWCPPQGRPITSEGARTSCLPPGGGLGSSCWTHDRDHRPSSPPPTASGGAPPAGGTPGTRLGRPVHVGPPPHGHPTTRESTRVG